MVGNVLVRVLVAKTAVYVSLPMKDPLVSISNVPSHGVMGVRYVVAQLRADATSPRASASVMPGSVVATAARASLFRRQSEAKPAHSRHITSVLHA